MSDLISKEVAIDMLKAVRDLVWDVDIPSPTVPEYIEHHEQMQAIMKNIDMLTEKIIKMPSVQSESEEMLSGRVWDEWCTGCKEYDHEKHCCPRFNRVIRTAIDDAQPERKNGEWEEIEVIADAYDISGVKTWASKMKCDQCGFTTIAVEGHFSQYNFCPNCGADMRENQNE